MYTCRIRICDGGLEESCFSWSYNYSCKYITGWPTGVFFIFFDLNLNILDGMQVYVFQLENRVAGTFRQCMQIMWSNFQLIVAYILRTRTMNAKTLIEKYLSSVSVCIRVRFFISPRLCIVICVNFNFTVCGYSNTWFMHRESIQ